MSKEYKAALVRALIIGLISAGATALTTWASTAEMKPIIITAGTAFLAPFLMRFGGEGTYDTRAAMGTGKTDDVVAPPATT